MTEGGSAWRIWDLHVHTPCSWLNNQYGDPKADATWKTYVSQLEQTCSELQIAALGVTDYFSIDGYKQLRKFQQEKGRLKDILLVPNIEFRINTIVYPEARSATDLGAGRRINLHVLFDPSLPPEKIEENFLHQLRFVDQERTFGPGDDKALTEANLLEFGSDHISQSSEFQGRSPLDVACSLAVVSEDQIKNVLSHDAAFREGSLIVLADENTSELKWGTSGHGIRQKLIQMSHAVFGSNKSTHDFYLGKKDDESVDHFIKEFGSLKPCYWGSDAHSCGERFLRPDQSRYLWLKCDPSWEGLRQTLFEPEERVSIGPTPPPGARSSYTMDRITIDCPQESTVPVNLESQSIPLNKGLVAIIGGRGSGKTALLDLLASAYSTGKREIQEKESSFVRRFLSDRQPGDNGINITYGFTGGQEFRTTIVNDDRWKVFKDADIAYLQQNHFDTITGNPDELKRQILKLVFDRFPQEGFAYKELCQKTALVQQAIKTCDVDISSASLQLEPMSRLASERDLDKGHITDLETQLQELETSHASDGVVQEAIRHKVELAQKQSNCESILLRLTEAAKSAETATDALSLFDWARINSDLLTLSTGYPELKQLSAESARMAVQLVMDQIESSKESLTALRQQLAQELLGISKTTDSLDQHQKESERINLELQNATNQCAERTRELERLGEVQLRIVDLKAKLKALYLSLITAHAEEQKYLQRLLEELTDQQDAELADLSFSADLIADVSGLLAEVLPLVNKRQVDPSVLEGALKEMCAAAVEWAKDLADTDQKSRLEYCIDAAFQLCEGKFNRGTTQQLFADALMTDHFTVQVQIGFQDVTIEHLSMGQRAVVLLKLVLASQDGPLLLDQPEEDLDNSYLYQELVPAIKRAKKRRQIILATHNANLVVSADAEEVVVAHCDNGVIHYDVGSLENLDMREQITQILEGGREAFQLRERKYGIRF